MSLAFEHCVNNQDDICDVGENLYYHLCGFQLAQGLFLFGFRHLSFPPF